MNNIFQIIASIVVLSMGLSQVARADHGPGQHDLSTELFEDQRSVPAGGNFSLKSSKGTVSLAEYQGKIVILLFGYLSCPDICPSIMRKVASALKHVDQLERESVQVLFVTLDPERDTLVNLDKFVHYFDESIIALSGTEPQIRQVASLYGVKFNKVGLEKSGRDYVINHSVASYILSPDNKIRFILSHETTSDDLVNVIHNLMKKTYP